VLRGGRRGPEEFVGARAGECRVRAVEKVSEEAASKLGPYGEGSVCATRIAAIQNGPLVDRALPLNAGWGHPAYIFPEYETAVVDRRYRHCSVT
jgi:hypothetical protein